MTSKIRKRTSRNTKKLKQWRGSLGVRDSERCWFTEEIGTYMRCWESPGDLPLVIEIFVSFRSLNLIQPTISLEMPVPSQGHYGFHSFPVVD
jgi:hypothetical protein